MKKILLYIIPALCLLVSCDKDDDSIFEYGPDERLKTTLAEYQSMLVNAPNGWMAAVGTQAGGAYQYWMKFNETNQVMMYADNNTTTANTSKTSYYRLKAMQRPTLIFDTYGYIHLAADPNGSVNGGANGTGLGSDFDLQFVSVKGDTINFEGRYNKCIVRFVKASATEASQVANGMLKKVQTDLEEYLSTLKYPYIEINNVKYPLSLGTRTTILSYKDQSGSTVEVKQNSYLDFNMNINLLAPITWNGMSFSTIKWTGTKYTVTIGNTTYDVKANGKPIYPLIFGVNKEFNKLTVDKSKLPGTMVDPFLTDVYDATYNSIEGLPRYMQYFTISYTTSSIGKAQMMIEMRYTNAAGTAYLANFYFDMETNPDTGAIRFTSLMPTSGNANTVGPRSLPLLSYFLYSGTYTVGTGTTKVTGSGNEFILDWAENNTPGLNAYVGGFFVVSDPDNFCPGTLSK